MSSVGFFCVFVVVCTQCAGSAAIFLVVPEDVPTALAGVYGFSPRLVAGRDHRVGFGFRLGNHADFQILYEIGPQLITRPLQTIQRRSVRQRRRPFFELLLRAGLLTDVGYYRDEEGYDEPR